MIAFVVALAVTAAPKDCGEDKKCFDAEAKTCAPAKLTRKVSKTNKVETVTTVEGVFGTECHIDFTAKVEETNPASHLRCFPKPEKALAFLDAGPHNGKPPQYPSDLFKDCKSPVCEPVAKLAKVCSISSCDAETQTLLCGADTCKVRRSDSFPHNCKVQCGPDGKPGCFK
jgi:hypothetical protein